MASTKKDAVAVVEHIEQLSLTDSHSDSDSEPELFRAYSDEQAEGNGRQRPPRYAALDDFDFLKTGSGTGNARGELKIVTDGGPGCGGHLWPSAVVLTRYIQHRIALNPSQWQNKTCVELGAGTGVVAIALAHLDVPGLKIYSTDLEELLPLARQNVELNGMQDKVKVEELYWGRPIPDTIPSQPDIILMADCIYLEITFPWLIDTLLRLSNEKTEILLCYKKRRNADKHFFSLLRKQFTFSHVQDDPMKPTYDREGLFLYSVKRKPTAIASVKRLRRKPTEPQL